MNADDFQSCVSLLKNKIFLGHYTGRHRVDEIDDFRDVIDIHSSEDDLKNNIDELLAIVHNSRTSVWVALSDAARNGVYCLWVQLDGIAFGYYWFQIKHVRLTGQQLFCVVSVVRSVPDQLVNPSLSFSQGFECAMRALRGAGGPHVQGNHQTNDAKDNNTSREIRENGRENCQQRNPVKAAGPFSFLKDFRGVTFDQMKASVSNEELGFGLAKTLMLCCFFTTIGAMNLIYECLVILTNIVVVTGDVTIRGIHALSRLIESLSPIFLGVLNFVGKIFTGLYILIAMLLGCTPYRYLPSQQTASPPRRAALMYRGVDMPNSFLPKRISPRGKLH